MSTTSSNQPRSAALGSQHIGIDESIEAPVHSGIGVESAPETKAKAKKAEKQFKVVGPRVVRPEPRLGWPRVKWHLLRLIARIPLLWGVEFHFTNPKLNRMDDDLQAIERLEKRLVELSQDRGRDIAVMNWKGGAGKTPTACFAAFILQRVTGDSTLLLEMNENNGTARNYFGFMPGQTLSLSEALEARAQLVDHEAFVEHGVRKHPDGVRLIYAAEDISNGGKNHDGPYPLAAFEELEHNASRAFHNTISDTGNGMKFQSNLASLKQADVVIIPSLFTNESKIVTVDGIASTIFALRQHGFGPKLLERGVFVVNSTSPKDDRDSVFDAVAEIIFENRDKRSKGVTDPATRKLMGENIMRYLGIERDRFFVIPYSEHITSLKLADPSPESIGVGPYRGYLESLVCAFEIPVEDDPVVDSDEQSSDFDAITADDSAWLQEQFGPRPEQVVDQTVGHHPETVHN